MQPDTVLTACSDGRILCYDLRGGSSSESMLAGGISSSTNHILRDFWWITNWDILDESPNERFLMNHQLRCFGRITNREVLGRLILCLQAAVTPFMLFTSTPSNLTLSPPAMIRSVNKFVGSLNYIYGYDSIYHKLCLWHKLIAKR